MDLNKQYNEMLATAKVQKAKGKSNETATATALKGKKLKAKQTEILGKAVSIAKAKGREFNIVDVFYKGMEYDKDGIKAIAGSDGFRYKATNKAGNEYTGVWRV